MLLSTFVASYAQSPDLMKAYQQVCTTLKEYKFTSEDVSSGGGNGRTKTISFSIKDGVLVFSFNDNYGAFADPFFGFKHGIKTVKVPLSDARFYMPSYGGNSVSITANSKNGVEFTYKNKKEIIDGYKIYGSDGSVKKLYDELNQILSIAKQEDFNGSIGASSSSKKSSKSHNGTNTKNTTTKTKKKVGKYVQ